MQRFEKIGLTLMNRTQGGAFMSDPIASVLNDRFKRAYAAQIAGQAHAPAEICSAPNTAAAASRGGRDDKGEIYGDEPSGFRRQRLKKPRSTGRRGSAADLTGGDAVPAPERSHRVRFGLIYGGLAASRRRRRRGRVRRPIDQQAGVVVVAPEGRGLGATQEIADHVGEDVPPVER